jgi:hypothetical protein
MLSRTSSNWFAKVGAGDDAAIYRADNQWRDQRHHPEIIEKDERPMADTELKSEWSTTLRAW